MSDGGLPPSQIVDMFGQHGFDVLCITDHCLDRKTLEESPDATVVRRGGFDKYLRILWKESQRAWEKYQMLLIPGAELSNNWGKYHILAIDIKEYIDPSLSVEQIVGKIHEQGAIAVACHPHHKTSEGAQPFIHLWEEHERYKDLFDAWEVGNRDDLFNAIGLKKFNYIANSDFHAPWHLYSWKTLLKCEKNSEAVKAAIRENRFVAIYLYRKTAR
jgi:predicted metal-dependent phosphoesterase TrpH